MMAPANGYLRLIRTLMTETALYFVWSDGRVAVQFGEETDPIEWADQRTTERLWAIHGRGKKPTSSVLAPDDTETAELAKQRPAIPTGHPLL